MDELVPSLAESYRDPLRSLRSACQSIGETPPKGRESQTSCVSPPPT